MTASSNNPIVLIYVDKIGLLISKSKLRLPSPGAFLYCRICPSLDQSPPERARVWSARFYSCWVSSWEQLVVVVHVPDKVSVNLDSWRGTKGAEQRWNNRYPCSAIRKYLCPNILFDCPLCKSRVGGNQLQSIWLAWAERSGGYINWELTSERGAGKKVVHFWRKSWRFVQTYSRRNSCANPTHRPPPPSLT